jgi:hypothetical protein
MSDSDKHNGNGNHPVEIEVDGEDLTVPDRDETPRQIIELARSIIEAAGKDPSNVYLVQVKGKRDRISYKDTPDEPIKLHQNESFITVSLGPTPVS